MRKILPFIKQAVIYFFIILFVYAAVSKITDFENFQVQVAQSPLLSAFATTIAYATVIGELIIALLLCIPKTQRLGLYLFLGMMTAFTVYIYLILNYSPFVPCSCGGILEKMGWTEHLWFNAITSMVAAAILLYRNTNKTSILLSIGTIIISSAIIVLLFITSEHIMKRENPFIRRFLPHHIDKAEYIDLGFNSYYIAGLTHDTIYLGNYTTPLNITAIPMDMRARISHQIVLDEKDRSFRSLTVKVNDEFFFVSDGATPIIYRGETKSWKALKFMETKIFFSKLQPIDNNSFLFRSEKADSGENVLGKITVSNSTTFELYDKVLKKQIDGIFDTDGHLITDSKTKQAIYTYYYRNQYLVYENKYNYFKSGKTIDTTTLAKIEVKTLANGERKMGAPPQKVNSRTYAYDKLLYVKSDLMGKNEPRSMWNEASIIDVYNYSKNQYMYSFYTYDYKKNKVKEFAINEEYFFGIIGNSLVRYKLNR
ncbi:Methylamine utilisation protein MauE [Paenimyroides ummariense]|uniref:Methylamine utilisation protein MauE n=1 Tax=Paenimyroides ummariense TaxID=913024 RepID=A0A1I5CVD9_9FLAO|nr:MauE/DoxX family redox-associated membrane protein [Paenimyroides ummariense]SFN90922.1 Methylamine utilisation protein MauE [Paenimyroides ummariense]